MDRKLLIRGFTLGFGLLTIYYLLESVFNILYFYPRLFNSSRTSFLVYNLQENLFQRAISDYFSLIIYSFLGLTFLTTPEEKIKNIHLLAGVVIFSVSILFFREQFESNFFYFFALNWYLK